MLSTSAVGAGGFAGANARLPYPSPKEKKQDARVHSRKRKDQKRNTRPPKNQGENTGKTRQGEPTHPEGERKTPLGQKNPKKNRQNNRGRTLKKVPSRAKPAFCSSVSSSKKVVEKRKQYTKKTSPAARSCHQSVLLSKSS